MRLRHDIQINKVTSINRRLIARIRNMLLVCCLASIFIIYMKNEIALTTATIVCYVSYFIIIGAAHGYLLWRLSTRDYLSMPIAAAIKEAATLELYRKRMRMWSYIMAAPVIFMLMMDIYKYGYPGSAYQRHNRRIGRSGYRPAPGIHKQETYAANTTAT